MYLRTTKRRNADGTEVRYYQLAENHRDPERGSAVAKVLYNFGRADELDVDQLRRLAASILRVVPDETVPSAAAIAAGDADIRIRDSWPYGGGYLLEQLWKELDIAAVLKGCAKDAGTKQPFERALFAMVANRALAPYSKLYSWEQWLREEVSIA